MATTVLKPRLALHTRAGLRAKHSVRLGRDAVRYAVQQRLWWFVPLLLLFMVIALAITTTTTAVPVAVYTLF